MPLLYHNDILVLARNAKVKTHWRRPRPDWGSVIETAIEYEDKAEFGYGKGSELFERMLEGFPWRTVADPFCGSGATILACERQNRRCLAMELSPDVAAAALERCERAGLTPILEVENRSDIAATPSRIRRPRPARAVSLSGRPSPA